MFVIEDELHAEQQDGEFETRQQAIAELRRRAAIPWDEAPNCAPCESWRTCGRLYVLVEYDDAMPGKDIAREVALDISADGVHWITPE